jgi:putative tryptophan/tyrosine transport system substrate-binding protein
MSRARDYTMTLSIVLMRRLVLVAATTLLSPLAVGAQELGRTYHLGGLLPFPRDAPQFIAFLGELRRAGFIEGQNLTIDPRGFGLRVDQFSEIATELVDTHLDVMMAGGDAAIRSAQQATATVPILAVTEDMVGSGLVRSLARPGRNTTGISLLATELDGKRQEILVDMLPDTHRIAALADPNTTALSQLRSLQDTARTRGIQLSIQRVDKPEEIIEAINAAQVAGAEAMNVLASPLLFAQRRLILERTAALHLPAIYQWPETAEEGGLVAYGPRIVQLFRDVLARQLVKLLRGTDPADLPVEQPTKFELVINLQTAKALGLAIPQSILARADAVMD